jgi:hypothetical protein
MKQVIGVLKIMNGVVFQVLVVVLQQPLVGLLQIIHVVQIMLILFIPMDKEFGDMKMIIGVEL